MSADNTNPNIEETRPHRAVRPEADPFARSRSLSQIVKGESSAKPELKSTAPPDDVPDWLKAMPTNTPVVEVSLEEFARLTSPIDDVPDWLKSLPVGVQSEPAAGRPVEILTEHPEVFWSENLGRKTNLVDALVRHADKNREFWQSLEGKNVLLKINMVDPDHPDSCTNPESLSTLIVFLASRIGVNHIYVGDLPAIGPMQKLQGKDGSERIINAYESLYRDVIKLFKTNKEPWLSDLDQKVHFVSLEDYPIDDLEGLGIGVINPKSLDVAAIINLTQPKEHGQYFFSCASKALMGLVPVEQRPAYFHPSNHVRTDLVIEAIQSGHLVYGDDYAPHGRGIILNPKSEATRRFILAAASEDDPRNMQAMAEFIQKTMRHYHDLGIPIVSVIDGYQVLRGNEHLGKPQVLDVAAVGLNPVAVDLAFMDKLGFDLAQVQYLEVLAQKGAHANVAGDGEVRPLPNKGLTRKVMDISTDAAGIPIWRLGIN